MLESSNMDFDDNEKQFVIVRGYLERCADCKIQLGEGYGDVDFFPTEELAKTELIQERSKLGVWEISFPFDSK